jgi:hypothetical protein
MQVLPVVEDFQVLEDARARFLGRGKSWRSTHSPLSVLKKPSITALS